MDSRNKLALPWYTGLLNRVVFKDELKYKAPFTLNIKTAKAQ